MRVSPGAVLALSVLLVSPAACVVTTHEGPGDPPRVPVTPPYPGSETPIDLESENGAPEAAPGAPARRPDEPDEIAASHILVMYRGSMRAPSSITRTKAEARARAEEALHRVQAGEPFEELVGEYSDEPGAAQRGGSLGRFRRNMMIKVFEDAAFALEPGKISELVESPFGFHIIKRTE